ncbi:MAG TPA: hypothetical protein VFV94_11210 [Polyangiaceae bacterium]|nr:hypothetical protein [Polyangiaceae bacterium]
MSTTYPGVNEPLPMPPPWRPEELVCPVPKRWGVATKPPLLSLRAKWLIALALFVAYCALNPMFPKFMLLVGLASMFAPYCGCCW